MFILFTLRPFSLASIGGMVTFILNPDWMAWSSVPLPVALRWVGVAIGVPALVLGIWTFHTIGTNITDTVVTRWEHTLVMHGPYRFVHHPFYATAFCGFLANALTTANWFIALTGATALALIVMLTTIEEAHLVKRFGGSAPATAE